MINTHSRCLTLRASNCYPIVVGIFIVKVNFQRQESHPLHLDLSGVRPQSKIRHVVNRLDGCSQQKHRFKLKTETITQKVLQENAL